MRKVSKQAQNQLSTKLSSSNTKTQPEEKNDKIKLFKTNKQITQQDEHEKKSPLRPFLPKERSIDSSKVKISSKQSQSQFQVKGLKTSKNMIIKLNKQIQRVKGKKPQTQLDKQIEQLTSRQAELIKAIQSIDNQRLLMQYKTKQVSYRKSQIKGAAYLSNVSNEEYDSIRREITGLNARINSALQQVEQLELNMEPVELKLRLMKVSSCLRQSKKQLSQRRRSKGKLEKMTYSSKMTKVSQTQKRPAGSYVKLGLEQKSMAPVSEMSQEENEEEEEQGYWQNHELRDIIFG